MVVGKVYESMVCRHPYAEDPAETKKWLQTRDAVVQGTRGEVVEVVIRHLGVEKKKVECFGRG